MPWEQPDDRRPPMILLPQQRLLIELLSMSGDIAVPKGAKDAILWRTLDECARKNMLTVSDINDGMSMISVTALGRMAVK